VCVNNNTTIYRSKIRRRKAQYCNDVCGDAVAAEPSEDASTRVYGLILQAKLVKNHEHAYHMHAGTHRPVAIDKQATYVPEIVANSDFGWRVCVDERRSNFARRVLLLEQQPLLLV
jgi:hypothetical protein